VIDNTDGKLESAQEAFVSVIEEILTTIETKH